jgi:hypothetical protein
MQARLRAHAVLRLQQVAVGRPGMGGAARDFLVAEMRRRGAAVLRCQVELLGTSSYSATTSVSSRL